MFDLDLRSRAPLYEQLVEKLKELIIKRVLPPDEKLPTVRSLAAELTINPNTIQKAYRELEHRGYIYSIPGKGHFVKPTVPQNHSSRLQALDLELGKILAEMLYLGRSSPEISQLVQNCLNEDKGGLSDD